MEYASRSRSRRSRSQRRCSESRLDDCIRDCRLKACIRDCRDQGCGSGRRRSPRRSCSRSASAKKSRRSASVKRSKCGSRKSPKRYSCSSRRSKRGQRPKYMLWKQQKDGRFCLSNPSSEDIKRIMKRAVMCRPRLWKYMKKRCPTPCCPPPVCCPPPKCCPPPFKVRPSSDEEDISPLPPIDDWTAQGPSPTNSPSHAPTGVSERENRLASKEDELLQKEAELSRREEENQKFMDDRERMMDELQAEQQDVTGERERVTKMSMDVVAAREQMMEHLQSEKDNIRAMKMGDRDISPGDPAEEMPGDPRGDPSQQRGLDDLSPGVGEQSRSPDSRRPYPIIEDEVPKNNAEDDVVPGSGDDFGAGDMYDKAPRSGSSPVRDNLFGAPRDNTIDPRDLRAESGPRDIDMENSGAPGPPMAPDGRRPEDDSDELREELINPEKESEMRAYEDRAMQRDDEPLPPRMNQGGDNFQQGGPPNVVHEIRERRHELEDISRKIDYEEDDLRKRRDEYQALADELLREERKLHLLRDAVEDKLRALEPMEEKLRGRDNGRESDRNPLRGGDGSPTRYVS